MGKVVDYPLVFFKIKDFVLPRHAVYSLAVRLHPHYLVQAVIQKADRAIRHSHCQDRFGLNWAKDNVNRYILHFSAEMHFYIGLVAFVDIYLLGDGGCGKQAKVGQAPG